MEDIFEALKCGTAATQYNPHNARAAHRGVPPMRRKTWSTNDASVALAAQLHPPRRARRTRHPRRQHRGRHHHQPQPPNQKHQKHQKHPNQKRQKHQKQPEYCPYVEAPQTQTQTHPQTQLPNQKPQTRQPAWPGDVPSLPQRGCTASAAQSASVRWMTPGRRSPQSRAAD